MTREEVSALIVSARKLEEQKEEVIEKLIFGLENNLDIFLDDYPYYDDESANNLKEGILCHINYGEGDLSCLLDAIEQALAEHQL
jgi:hypothetical protein